ncbi:hypothetical protein [Streptomyces sp. NBC_00207]|uniref:hypothetical protein n=1 Tax=unclassified Streptomyces TaxID=2593676 RepID=UPI0028873F28|nr:hypothetical protein [Streptomyces sp. DSM 41633]
MASRSRWDVDPETLRVAPRKTTSKPDSARADTLREAQSARRAARSILRRG